jgi:hypothetical protein
MGIFGQRKNSLAFKGALTLLYLILLGSQLSHKFYLCANSPIRAIKAAHRQCASDEPPIGQESMRLKHKNVSTLSIDKRYEFEHTFAVPAPEISLQVEYSEIRTQVFFECWSYIPVTYVIQPFRGPPTI